MSKATKERIVRLKIRETFVEMKWVTTGVSISLTTQTNKTLLNISSGCKRRANLTLLMYIRNQNNIYYLQSKERNNNRFYLPTLNILGIDYKLHSTMQLKAFIRQKYILFTASHFPPISRQMVGEKKRNSV